MSYKDMTFCRSWKECKNGNDCHRAITEDIIEKSSGTNLPLSIAEKFDCFEQK